MATACRRLLHAHVGGDGEDRQADQARGPRAEQAHGHGPACRVAVRAAVQERPEQQDQEEEGRQDEGAHDLVGTVEVAQQLEEEHEVPFGPCLVGLRGIGRRLQGGRLVVGPDPQAHEKHQASTPSFRTCFGQNGSFSALSWAADSPPGRGDAVAAEQVEMDHRPGR